MCVFVIPMDKFPTFRACILFCDTCYPFVYAMFFHVCKVSDNAGVVTDAGFDVFYRECL